MTTADASPTTNSLRQAVIFVVSVLVVSWSFEAYIVTLGGVRAVGPHWLVALMCIPGAVSIVQRVIFRLGFTDAGLRPGPLRFYSYAVAVPLVLALLAGGLSSLLDIRHFALVAPEMRMPMATIGLAVLGLGVIGAVGEEIGWRGFLLPKLVASGIKHPYLITALVWAVWHLPLIAFGGFYETQSWFLMALVYGAGIVAISYFLSELRMRSGSVWVAAVAHAAHNFIFQFAVPALVLTQAGTHAAWWDLISGDTGLLVAALYAVAFVAGIRIVRRRGESRRLEST